MTRYTNTNKTHRDPIVGQKIGKLLVMKRLPDRTSGAKNVRAVVQCTCDCGSRIEVPRYYLVRENPKLHCGCENANSLVKKFSGEYGIWQMMKKRCYDTTHVSYAEYGGRGIRVSARWLADFEVFISDIGIRPTPHHSLDRIDVNGNYEKGNVRWATQVEQAANKRGSAPQQPTPDQIQAEVAEEVEARVNVELTEPIPTGN